MGSLLLKMLYLGSFCTGKKWNILVYRKFIVYIKLDINFTLCIVVRINVSMFTCIYLSYFSNTLLDKCWKKYATNHKQKKSCDSRLQYMSKSDLFPFFYFS